MEATFLDGSEVHLSKEQSSCVRSDKMLDPNCKTSPKLSNRRSGTSNSNTNHRPFSRYVNTEKVTAMPSNKVSACPVPPNESTTRKAYDNHIKMKLVDLAPRNPGKETSEGVQEFIKHVSDFIEKKNPLKETFVFSREGSRRKGVKMASISSIQFNGTKKKQGEKKKAEDVKTGTNNPTEENLNNPAENSSPTSLKSEVICVKERTNRPSSVTKKRNEERYQRGYSSTRKRSESTPGKNLAECASLYRKGALEEVKSFRIPSQRQERFPIFLSQNKNRRPSEIPLRKNRPDFAKKQNKVALLMQKPLAGFDSESSLGVYSKDSLFSMTDDVGFCSEVQMTFNFSSERLSSPGELQVLYASEDETNSLNDSPKTSVFEEFSGKTISGKRAKMADAGKVKTSSFTVIRTSSAVLNKLESLHKQNVHAKEKSLSEKGSSKQKAAVVSKSSANSLKGRNSKKSLHSRTSNKGNKPGLKTKTKKPNKGAFSDTESSKMKKKPPGTKSQTSNLNFQFREVTLASRKTDKRPKKKENQPPAKKPLPSGTKSPRKQANPKPKEEPEKLPVTQTNPKPELETHKLERPKTSRNPPLMKKPSKPSLKVSNSEEAPLKVVDILKSDEELPINPPPTPEAVDSTIIRGIQFEQAEEEEEGWSPKSTFFDKANSNFPWCDMSTKDTKEPEESPPVILESHPSSAQSLESTKPGKSDFVVKGTPLAFIKDSSEKDSEQPAVKKHLTIDLRKQEDTIEYRVVENSTEDKTNQDSVPEKEEKCPEEAPLGLENSDVGKEEKEKQNENFADDLKQANTTSSSLILSKPRNNFSSLKRKPQFKPGIKLARKKKLRSDAGDRPVPYGRNLFDSQTKPDLSLRCGLTKGEEKREVFEDAHEVKLRRRNSEPISFRGYVWKRADSATPRGHQPSVSSMTSSLKHLNTDDIDDFILWEAIPQKLTSCWEMSLYHIKRPWSVLSCSVFKDNRMSNTPGLILKNLRNDSRRAAIIQNERSIGRKENPFDVEPSIAQKNIDIRNWLAALNFPTPPSTSTDGFNEGNFPTQLPPDTQNLSKAQVNQKRRKVLSDLKFPEDLPNKNIEDKEKHRKFSKWNSSDGEGLTDLIRRKSGGFVTKEQFVSCERSAHGPKVTVNLCVYSKSAEDSFLMDANDRNAIYMPKKYKSLEVTSQPEVSISATIISSRDGVGKMVKLKEKPQEPANPGKKTLGGFLREEMNQFFSDVNIWKYLFLLTVCLVLVHCCYCKTSAYRQ